MRDPGVAGRNRKTGCPIPETREPWPDQKTVRPARFQKHKGAPMISGSPRHQGGQISMAGHFPAYSNHSTGSSPITAMAACLNQLAPGSCW